MQLAVLCQLGFFKLQAVIHFELDGMGRHAKLRDFFHLQFDVGIEHVIAENAALGKE